MTVGFQNGSYVTGTAALGSLTASGGISSGELLNKDFLDNKYSYYDARESYEIAYSGRDAAINADVANIASYIANGQEDKVIAAYQSLLDEMKAQERYSQLVSESGDDTQLRAIARQLIESSIGCDLEDYIRENTRDSVDVQKQKLYRGDLCDSTTQEELLLEMCNIEEEEGQLNIFQKGWHGLFGTIAKGWNAIFGDGKKH